MSELYVSLKMKIFTLLLSLMSLSSCKKTENFPSEFVGVWTSDTNSIYRDIEDRNLPKDDELAMKYSFADIEKNQTCKITKDGRFTFPQLPTGVYIQMTLVSQSKDGYVFKHQNSLNPSVSEYTLDRIKNGTWTSVLITEKMEVIDPASPNTYWHNKTK